MRSLKEINKYMGKLKIPEEEQGKIINRLRENHFIDEKRFVEAFISDKINLSNDGPNKIKNELLQHEIDILLIEKYLSEYDDSVFINKIKKLIQKKLNNNRYSENIMKQKLTSYFLDLGYSIDMIKEEVNKISVDNKNNLEKDYLKIRKKLSSKYERLELRYQIKNKLHQKGYRTSEINELLETKKEA